MSRTPIPDGLIHKAEDVEENGRLFDAFVSLVELDSPELRQVVAANLLEKIRLKIIEDGEFKLPLGLVVRRS
ncbi:MAG: hypothetical protein A3B86_04050 [Candidatus Yanofskybacteria bacterium RIFCSPHIGHO2_02_FULL_38_22b]|uniref:Uncharacterized protein n=1 Tax=Candidatus Yanofskybacteria bacterium RIFCSPHIGHO2_02_FULL_38_22b TaxID=1802673 RepID=A0A1F8EZG6_9BACT|nr:MAG: hypothetical protein A2816_01820 [Candidatus Yanofskybacteria bacterium RIFCSPHIGHO2_01_FULL_39_44]OGN06264.1 MAG: hypothetical protein A3B86_04050 [Candidatus Yanofskybacteria bacterium RIFCSPHIGHO2_02_FULL_38_22b]OGN19684.1 MAG: hypothetical protein A2910_03785 [Candidatus Yanofskybacteria bacterium RIFCSPLOWO2_01_FULL_39_28]